MRFARGDDFIAGARQHPQRDLVGHRPGRYPKRRLFAKQLRHARLKLVGGGVLAILIVPNQRGSHCRAHGVGWTSDRVGTQVDGLDHDSRPIK